MHKVVIILIAGILLSGCNEDLVYSKYEPTTNASWDRSDIKEFTFSNTDTINPHHLYIALRNDATFPYSNLFLLTSLEFPSGTIIRDTLEYQMAAADGTWLGQGVGSLIENRLWYKENIVFPSSGVYTLQVSHAMRDNGSVEGLNQLPGVTDVGLEIKKAN